MQQTSVTGAVQSKFDYLVHLWGSYLTTEAFMSKSGIAHMLYIQACNHIYVAYHQVLSYGSLAKPDSYKKSKGLASRDYIYGMLWTKILTVLNLWSPLLSSSVHLDPWSLLGVT